MILKIINSHLKKLSPLLFMLAVTNCHAVTFLYIFVPAPNANAQQIINNAFSQGLAPDGTPSSNSGTDFWNFLSRPIDNPLFLLAYQNANHVQLASERPLEGVLFEVALDRNIRAMIPTMHNFQQALDDFNDPEGSIRRMISRLIMDQDRRLPLGIIGFDRNRINNTAIHGAWIYINGQPQPLQGNGNYHEPADVMPVGYDFGPMRLQFNRNLQALPRNRVHQMLVSLACFVWHKRSPPPGQLASTDYSCTSPISETVEQFDMEYQPIVGLPWISVLMN
ncbi:hypothetical protein [Dyella choica]|uniref:Uncharacterized protein n=1 Tax=Dyella choica TaxID=1927959 RepID=A0A3S0PQD2_9GAMM|nr:hypothetical protein [Dyella choica]RUL78267.1 hypothetical protein EKH80_05410 [Dyella choica]